jgi:hypothetical protein
MLNPDSTVAGPMAYRDNATARGLVLGAGVRQPSPAQFARLRSIC